MYLVSRCSVEPGRSGYTLLEVIVVLVLLAVAAAVVAPSLLSSGPDRASALPTLVATARAASVRRGEVVRLRIDRAGNWQARAGTGSTSQLLMSGRLTDSPASAIDLIFSPLGTCAPAVESDRVETLTAYDPLTCEARPS
jgi:prepilin-type N-terminal cleavage/methylation domain-containing protein